MSGYIGNIPVPQSTQTRDNFTATSGQTTFSTSGYTPNYLDVYLNGIHLDPSDYTATNGTDVVLASGATVGDVVTVVAYQAFEVADQAFSGDFSVDGSTFVVDSTNDKVGIGTSSPLSYTSDVGLEISSADPIIRLNDSGAATDYKNWEIRNIGASAGVGYEGLQFRRVNDANTVFTECMRIDNAGRVTMPYQPAFIAKGTNYTQNNSAATAITTNTTMVNIGNHYNGTAFTAPVAGTYQFSFWGLSYPHDEPYISSLQFRVNGSGYGQNMQFGGDSTEHRGIAGTSLIYLNANDQVTLMYTPNTGTPAKAYASQWNYSGHLIG